MTTKPFVKGQLVRVVSHDNRICRVEHLGVHGDVALVRTPGPSTFLTWSSWMPITDLRHVSAVDRLAEVVGRCCERTT